MSVSRYEYPFVNVWRRDFNLSIRFPLMDRLPQVRLIRLFLLQLFFGKKVEHIIQSLRVSYVYRKQ